MKKLLNILLLITFQFGYLEWGKDKQMFIFNAVLEVFSKAKEGLSNVLHPFILVPFAGELLLLYTLFQAEPSRKLTLTGLACLSVLMLFLFFIGLISLNFKILLSTIPFLAGGIIILMNKSKGAPARENRQHGR